MKLYCNALSLSRLRRQPSALVASTACFPLWLKICHRHIFLTRRALPEGAFGLCAPKVCLIFLTSTDFVGTKAKPRIRRGKFYLIRLFLKFKYSSSLSKKLSYLGNSLSKYIVVINSSCVLKSSIVEKYIGFLKLI